MRELYERWAPVYPVEPDNALTRAEHGAMLRWLPEVSGRSALDLACGSGRYAKVMTGRGAQFVVALDFSQGMLRQVRSGAPVRGELDRLPLRNASFDLVISGLALGYARDLVACMREISRVLKPGGILLYSDFHPQAQQRGHVRSFCAANGERLELPPSRHDREAHLAALAEARLTLCDLFEPRVGIEFREEFRNSGPLYRDCHGVPLLFIARARKT